MFKSLELEKYYRLINHGPCVMVTTGNDEKLNVAPIAWNMPLNDEPPMLAIAIAESHYTAELIQKTGSFAVNIPDQDMLPAVMIAGKSKGRKEDKFKKANLKLEKGIKIETPHLKDAAGFIECKLKEKHVYDGVILFIAEVVYAGVKEDLFDEYWITEKAKVVHHLGNGYFASMGKRFKA
ncbi:flavin reductase family protein [Elusimicrobiota bacterium]